MEKFNTTNVFFFKFKMIGVTEDMVNFRVTEIIKVSMIFINCLLIIN